MKRKWIFCTLLLLSQLTEGVSQDSGQSRLKISLKNISWWSGVINHAEMMPLRNGYHANLESNYGNQVQPLMLSSRGHVIWSESPFGILVKNDTLFVWSADASLRYAKAGETLKEGYRYASQNFFPPSGKLPDILLFSKPQYNTWIELMYDQNQKDVLDYANQIIANGFPPGVIMIDDNWQEDYGKWDFHPGRFNNPRSMVDSLHKMGFKVMLWVCPFVSPDCDVFRKLREEGSLLTDKTGGTAIVPWWNGHSALLDLSKESAVKWFKEQLEKLKSDYGVDGFKFDAGDFEFYSDCYSDMIKVNPREHSELFARIGLDYPFNEYRAMWKMGGQPIANRLRDKDHSWEDLQKLIPGILVQGLMGYGFACPDLIGGGEYLSFLSARTIDQELIVRSAQCHALMPMMQFSVAPWRVLDDSLLNVCRNAVRIRAKFIPLILNLARQSASNGEPVARPMEYVFPHQGYTHVNDQFMLGDSILVAPVVERDMYFKDVILPKGKWEDDLGSIHEGNQKIRIQVGIDRLPFYRRL